MSNWFTTFAIPISVKLGRKAKLRLNSTNNSDIFKPGSYFVFLRRQGQKGDRKGTGTH